jgi:hypothetical protein
MGLHGPTAGTTIIDPNDPTRKADFDNAFKALLIMDVDHFKIHEGHSYHAFVSTTSLTSGDIGFRFTTPSNTKKMHLMISVTSQDDGYFTFYEGGNPTGGAAFTPLNRDRNSSNTSDATEFFAGEVATGGTPTVLCSKDWGLKNRGGGEFRGIAEWILATDTTYHVVLGGTGNSPAWMTLDWYEHADE